MSYNPGASGGGGSLSGANDVALSNVQSTHFLGFNAATSKWTNKPAPVATVPTNTSDLTNDGAGATDAIFATIKGATKIEVVTTMPSSPDANTLYFVRS